VVQFFDSLCTLYSIISMFECVIQLSTRSICLIVYKLFLQISYTVRRLIRPLTHAPEIGTMGLNSTPDSSATFSCRCTTSRVIDPKAVSDVVTMDIISGFCSHAQNTQKISRLLTTLTAYGARRQSMTPESDDECMVPISGACVRGLMISSSDDV